MLLVAGLNASAVWQLTQETPSEPLWGSTWQPRQVFIDARPTHFGPRGPGLWQLAQAIARCLPSSTTPVCAT